MISEIEMPKRPALAVKRADLEQIGLDLSSGQKLFDIPFEFWDLDTFVADRDICETDPSIQQLLPYIVLINSETGKFFVYGRGKGGAESRLVGKLSIGLGGHVDHPNYGNLSSLLREEAYRELKEEANVVPSAISFYKLISDQLPDGNEVPVGSVHIGLLGLAFVTDDDIGELEEGIILDGTWMDKTELLQNLSRFENWSKMIISDFI